MDLFKLDKYDKYFVCFILVVLTIFNIGQCFAAETENVDVSVVNGLYINLNGNFFQSSSNAHLIYFQAEKGYIYHIYNDNSGSALRFVTSTEVPSANVPYELIGTIDPKSTYDYISNNNETLYLDVSSNETGSNVVVTRELIPGYNGAVSELVDNVGVNQIWSVFENGISFVGVVVLVAFGIFLVVLAIRKVSKGKSEF